MEKTKAADLLFMDTLNHTDSDQTNSAKSGVCRFEDKIQFSQPVHVELIRIPHRGKELYGKLVSDTQSEQIESIEIFYRNVAQGGIRFGLVTANSQLLTSEAEDIFITPKQAVYTDFLVVSGHFTKITLCVYGRIVQAGQIGEHCRNFSEDVDVLTTRDRQTVQLNRSVFGESSNLVSSIEAEVKSGNTHLNLDYVDCWHEISNDDEIHEPQIRNISNISQSLLTSLSPENLSQETFIATFRYQLQELTNILSKIFKSKHLGLYYPTPHRLSTIPNHLPLGLAELALYALNLARSDQIRGLELLKYVVQLESHAKRFVEKQGLKELTRLFVEFFLPEIVTLSTFKTVIIQVLIALAHWPFAARWMVTKIEANIYHRLFEDPEETKPKKEPSKEKEHSRSRNKTKGKKEKPKDSSDDSSDSEENDRRKRKRDRKKYRSRDRSKDRKGSKRKDKEREREREKEKEKEREKEREREKDRDRRKKEKTKQKEKDKSKDKSHEKQEKKDRLSKNESKQQPKIVPKGQSLSFYEAVISVMMKNENSKLIYLLKALIQQITQTLTHQSKVGESVAITTGFLRDSKQLFAPSGQLISNKSLKMFAMFQPFLNEVQSLGAEGQFISQLEKVKEPAKYDLDPMVYKLINAINWKIASKECDQFIMTQYDQEFMTLMSGLINCEEVSTTGLNRIISSFKVDGLLSLKKQEAVVSIMCEYIYRVLLEDDGLTTLLYLDQIHSALIKISNWFNEGTSFSREIKRRVRFLNNYALSYDYFLNTDGVFKSFSDYFLKLFRYDHYEINKIGDYKKKQFERAKQGFKYEHLKETIQLGSFYDLLPQQPLLQIDVSLKIFLVLTGFNKNIWTTFYQYKLASGFSVLFNRISSFLVFLLTPSPEQQKVITELQYYQQLVDNHLTVSKHLLMLLMGKAKYETAFNQLIEEDIFEEVELYEKCLEMYIAAFNALSSDQNLFSKKYTARKLKKNLSLILEIIYYLLQGFELTNNAGREAKIKNLVRKMYIKHYDSICNRAPILALIGQLCQLADTNSHKLLNHILLSDLDSSEMKPENQNQPRKIKPDEILLPENEKSLCYNLLMTNVFRNDKIVKKNLVLLFNRMLKVPAMLQGTLGLIEKLFDDTEQNWKVKEPSEIAMEKAIALKKMEYVVSFIEELDQFFKNRLGEKRVKLLKSIEPTIDKMDDSESIKVLFLKLRNSILIHFEKTCSYLRDTSMIEGFLKFFNKYLQISITEQLSALQKEKLITTSIALKILIALSGSPFHQSIILYGQFFERPYKPNCQFTFTRLIDGILQAQAKLSEQNELRAYLSEFAIGLTYVLCRLTSIDQREFYSTDSRRNALCCLLGKEKQFAYEKLSQLDAMLPIPKEMMQTLKDYFHFPVVEKDLTAMQIQKSESNEAKVVKPKSWLFSKYVFDMISEGDPVSRTRFQFVVGSWHGGDIVQYSEKQGSGAFRALPLKDFDLCIQLSLSKIESGRKEHDFSLTYKSNRTQQITVTDFVVYHPKRKFPEPVKKVIEIPESLKKAPETMKMPQEQIRAMPMHNLSESSMPNAGMSDMNSPEGNRLSSISPTKPVYNRDSMGMYGSGNSPGNPSGPMTINPSLIQTTPSRGISPSRNSGQNMGTPMKNTERISPMRTGYQNQSGNPQQQQYGQQQPSSHRDYNQGGYYQGGSRSGGSMHNYNQNPQMQGQHGSYNYGYNQANPSYGSSGYHGGNGGNGGNGYHGGNGGHSQPRTYYNQNQGYRVGHNNPNVGSYPNQPQGYQQGYQPGYQPGYPTQPVVQQLSYQEEELFNEALHLINELRSFPKDLENAAVTSRKNRFNEICTNERIKNKILRAVEQK